MVTEKASYRPYSSVLSGMKNDTQHWEVKDIKGTTVIAINLLDLSDPHVRGISEHSFTYSSVP